MAELSEWLQIMLAEIARKRDDLERARPEIRPGDIVIVNTGWHRYYGDNRRYFVESPGTYKEAGEWLRDRGVKGFGIDCQALDHPLGGLAEGVLRCDGQDVAGHQLADPCHGSEHRRSHYPR